MLFNASVCQNEDKSCAFPKFPMNILTWFKPTVELDGLMALMCSICQERGGWLITRQGWKKVGRDVTQNFRAPLSMSDMFSSISKT